MALLRIFSHMILYLCGWALQCWHAVHRQACMFRCKGKPASTLKGIGQKVFSKFQHWRAVEENRLQANWVRPKEQRQNGRVLFGASCRTQIHGRLALPLMYLSRNVITWLLIAWGIFQVNNVEACSFQVTYRQHHRRACADKTVANKCGSRHTLQRHRNTVVMPSLLNTLDGPPRWENANTTTLLGCQDEKMQTLQHFWAAKMRKCKH